MWNYKLSICVVCPCTGTYTDGSADSREMFTKRPSPHVPQDPKRSQRRQLSSRSSSYPLATCTLFLFPVQLLLLGHFHHIASCMDHREKPLINLAIILISPGLAVGSWIDVISYTGFIDFVLARNIAWHPQPPGGGETRRRRRPDGGERGRERDQAHL
jgi:hypothetical protein